MRISILLLWCCCVVSVAAQERVTLNGYLKDSLTGETLIGANLQVVGQGKGVQSNQYGFYSISLEKGVYRLLVSFIGYQTAELTIDLKKDIQQNILLLPNTAVISNVTVVARKRENNVKTAQMGKI